MLFQDYAKSAGLQLLHEDVAFIRKCLHNVNHGQRVNVMRKYTDIWIAAMNACQNTSKKQNSGRRAANAYLMDIAGGIFFN